MATNFWKPFGGWGTALRDERLLFRTRIKITLALAAAGVLIMLGAMFFIVEFRENFIGDKLTEAIPDSVIRDHLYRTLVDSLRSMLVVAGLVLVAIIAAVSYLLAGFSLRPLKRELRVQRRFIADASHELRTPLSIMKANAEVALLDKESLSTDELIGAVRSNLEEVDRTVRILNHLLLLAQYDSGAIQIPFSTVNFTKLADNIVERLQPLADKENLSLSFYSNSPDILVPGYYAGLEEIMLNVLNNALEHTPDGGQINVRLDGHGDYARLVVQDSGIGIPENDMPYIFEPFYKKTSFAGIRRGKGAGLGLSIVQQIVERHGGKVSISSKENHGTTVVVRIPLRPRPYFKSFSMRKPVFK